MFGAVDSGHRPSRKGSYPRTARRLRMLRWMARTCIFCGGTKMTREHIWPEWAAERAAHVGALQHRSHGHLIGSDPFDRVYEQMPYQQKARVVCQACNTGWMSQLENAAKPYFETMLHGRGRVIHEQAQRTLSAWAFKTCTVFVESQAKDKSVIPHEDRIYLREHRQPPGNVYVLMVAYDGTHPTIGDSYGIDATTRDDRKLRSIWGANITFGPVAFHVFGSDVPQLLRAADITVPSVHQIWPRAKPFSWTPTPCWNTQELRAMIDGSLQQYRQLTGMNITIL